MRHEELLHVVSSERSVLRYAGNSGITRSGPLSEMPALPPRRFSCRNHERRESDERQQKDDLPVDRQRARHHLPNSERPATGLLQFAVQRRHWRDR